MLDFEFSEIAQVVAPMTVLREILRDSLRKQDVAGIAAIHDALRDINSGTRHICSIVHIRDAIDRSAVNPHAQMNSRMIF